MVQGTARWRHGAGQSALAIWCSAGDMVMVLAWNLATRPNERGFAPLGCPEPQGARGIPATVTQTECTYQRRGNTVFRSDVSRMTPSFSRRNR